MLPSGLQCWSRLYWAIENRVHYVRDMALKEVGCRMHKGSLPQVMAAFANLAISVLRLLGKQNVKRAMSNLKMRPHTAVGGVWSTAQPREAPRPDRRQLARSRTAVGAAVRLQEGIGPPSRAGYLPNRTRSPVPARRSPSR